MASVCNWYAESKVIHLQWRFEMSADAFLCCQVLIVQQASADGGGNIADNVLITFVHAVSMCVV